MKNITKQLIFAGLLTIVFAFAIDAQSTKINENRCSGANDLTETEISAVLEAHNKIRADVGLPKLVWKCGLADLAQQWATRGIFEHRSDLFYGENIFVSSDTAAAPVDGVQAWLAEKSFWDNSAGICQAGKVCVHYTQMVWKNTTEVGCGINRNASGKWKVLMVCNYNPMGNFIGKAAY